MILCVPVTIFETCRYGKVGRTGWPIGEICQVMVLRVSSEYNLFRKTNPSTTKIMTAEKLLVKRCKTRWTKGQNWTVFYLYFSQKKAIWGRRRTKTWIFCYGSHLHDQEKLLKHLRAQEGAWAAKRQQFFMETFFGERYRHYAIRGAFSPLRRQLPGDRETLINTACCFSHLHDEEKLLKHLRAREGAWAAKRRPFFMGAEFANTGSEGCRPGCVLATSASVCQRVSNPQVLTSDQYLVHFRVQMNVSGFAPLQVSHTWNAQPPHPRAPVLTFLT